MSWVRSGTCWKLDGDDPLGRQIGDEIVRRVAQDPVFMSAALPRRFYPPLFNRYGQGESFGFHVDNAVRGIKNVRERVRKVEPVRRGERIASFFWVESLVREDSQRNLLLDMDVAIQLLTRDQANPDALVQLTGCYHNLLRRWSDV